MNLLFDTYNLHLWSLVWNVRQFGFRYQQRREPSQSTQFTTSIYRFLRHEKHDCGIFCLLCTRPVVQSVITTIAVKQYAGGFLYTRTQCTTSLAGCFENVPNDLYTTSNVWTRSNASQTILQNVSRHRTDTVPVRLGKPNKLSSILRSLYAITKDFHTYKREHDGEKKGSCLHV